MESTIPSQTTNKRYSSIISSNQNVTNKSDIIHKPAIPPKPNNGLIASRLSKRSFEESRQKFKLKESKAKPKRKGNSLPVMSMTKLSANDKTQKSISVDCVNQRTSKQYSRQSQESLFQRFVKEASSSISVNSNKNVKRTGSDGVIITPHTVNRHTQFFPDNNGKKIWYRIKYFCSFFHDSVLKKNPRTAQKESFQNPNHQPHYKPHYHPHLHHQWHQHTIPHHCYHHLKDFHLLTLHL